MNKNRIERVMAREILDSRGNPTVEATVILEDGSCGVGASPSGASTGKYEAHEVRDGNKERYSGKGVLAAVGNINRVIHEELHGMRCDLGMIDNRMIQLDGTENKKCLGANAILAVSIASARAAAAHYKIPLYRYLGGISGKTLPIPMMNILNGGAHAANSVDIQEFMIVPAHFETFSEALQAGTEIYHKLGVILRAAGYSATVGDEGGFAPEVKSADEALDCIVHAIEESGYTTDQIKIGLDIASSEWADGTSYKLPKSGRVFTPAEMIREWKRLIEKYPIVSLEDGLGEDDDTGWDDMTAQLGKSCMLVGDDYFVTNPDRLQDSIRKGRANSILIKPNQIGTLSETMDVIRIARRDGYRTILSHRSGETTDTVIADLAVALNAGFIKAGAPSRSERTAKYNRLLRIENELCGDVIFAGEAFLLQTQKRTSAIPAFDVK